MQKQQIEIPKRLLSVAETARYLGVSRQQIYNATSPKSEIDFPVKPKRIGRSIKFDRKELDEYIDAI